MSVPAQLDPSELGTKEHWDEVYARELENHSKDSNDEGTVWFDENGAEEAVLRLLNSLVEDGLLGRSDSRVLDLGCGNGHMLFTLREGDEDVSESAWTAPMVGVDYSAASIQLAQQIAEQRELDGIFFERWDMLVDEPGPWLEEGFRLVLDKGTFDAISLMEQSPDGLRSCEVYCSRVVSLMSPDDVLVITSCNWTKAELLSCEISFLHFRRQKRTEHRDDRADS